MDKYDFNIKVEKLKKAAKEGDWAGAMGIADQIDWRRVSSVSLLSLVSEVYEKNGDYTEAKEILLLAYEQAPLGKRLLYKLTTLSIQDGEVNEAEAFYREFYDVAPDDPRQHILRYLILKAKGAPIPQLINTLEVYNRLELNEKWLYELAELYHQAGRSEDCVRVCDQIMLMFGIGQYVDKAIDLKKNKEGVDLTEYQQSLIDNREKYEERLRQFRERDDVPEPTAAEADEAPAVSWTSDETSEEELNEVAKLKESVASLGIVRSEHEGAESTKVFKDIHHSAPVPVIIATPAVEVSAPAVGETAEAVEETPAEEPAAQETAAPVRVDPADIAARAKGETKVDPLSTVNFLVERRSPAEGLEQAKNLLKLMHQHTGSANQVAKVTAERLNGMGIAASRDKLAGRDLIVEEAGDLSAASMKELIQMIEEEPDKRVVVLIDNPMQLKKMISTYPEIMNLFHLDKEETKEPEAEPQSIKLMGEKEPEIVKEPAPAPVRDSAPAKEQFDDYEDEEDYEESFRMDANDTSAQMDIDEFADYCMDYANSIDCSINGKSKLALYERIEIMEEDGIPLTQNNAIALIEEAADRAEKPTFGQRISGLFSAKYDKDDKLILKEEHFIP